ncbi:MAG: hypothetical protein WCH86_02380 [Kiritimatiellales bacterium]
MKRIFLYLIVLCSFYFSALAFDYTNSYLKLDGLSIPFAGLWYDRPEFFSGEDESYPIDVYFNGGGWVIGDDYFNRRFSNNSLSYDPPLLGWYDEIFLCATNLNLALFSGAYIEWVPPKIYGVTNYSKLSGLAVEKIESFMLGK